MNTSASPSCNETSRLFSAAVTGSPISLPRPQGDLTDFARALKQAGTLPPAGRSAPYDGPAEQAFLTRMLYSCAVDGYCLEDFPEPDAPVPVPMSRLEERLHAFLQQWYPPAGDLNRLRCELLDECRCKGRACPPGFFTLTAPTGSGKTISALAFALAHACAHHRERIFYVVPYISVIDQTAQIFREILGRDQVLEHHSGILCNLDGEVTPSLRAAENWDAPVVVITAVEFFQCLHSDQPARCRGLHNLANSVVIFDEAQMVPTAYLRPCLWSVVQLVKHYGVSALHCTACRPVFGSLLRAYLPEVPSVELCPAQVRESPLFQRVTFRKAGVLSWDHLADLMNQHKQILCIVNSRQSSRELYRRMRGEGCFHLSTLAYPAHRTAMLREIRRRLASHMPCRVVATSLVEVGVDVDFPVVLREEAGLDSILQAAGRCNREGRRLPEDSFVTVFQTCSRVPDIFSAALSAGQETLKYHPDFVGSQSFLCYFQKLLEDKPDSELDRQGILSILDRDPSPFRAVAQRFHLINDPVRTVYIPLGEGDGLARRLAAGERSRALFRQLGRYSVCIHLWQFELLRDADMLAVLEDGSAILKDLRLYDQASGLSASEAAIIQLRGND